MIRWSTATTRSALILVAVRSTRTCAPTSATVWSAGSPSGTVTGFIADQSNLVEGDTITDSLDALVDLISQLEANLATPTAIVIDPLGWGVLRKLKAATDWNQSLLGAGTVDATPMLLSLPVLTNVGCPQYSGYVLDRNAVVSAVGPVRIAVSEHQFFSSDSVLVRGTWRTGFAVTRPERVGRFDIAAPGS